MADIFVESLREVACSSGVSNVLSTSTFDKVAEFMMVRVLDDSKTVDSVDGLIAPSSPPKVFPQTNT